MGVHTTWQLWVAVSDGANTPWSSVVSVAKSYGILNNQLVDVTDSNKNQVVALNNNKMYLSADGKVSAVSWSGSQLVTVDQYITFQNDLKTIQDWLQNNQHAAQYTLQSLHDLVQAKWSLKQWMTSQELIVAGAFYRNFGAQSTLANSNSFVTTASSNVQSNYSTSTVVTPTSTVNAQQSQIDALKALLDQSTSIGDQKLTTQFAPSLWLWMDTKKEADGTTVLSFKANPQWGTLNPYRSYQNWLVNKVIDQLNRNTSDADAHIVNDMLKLTRLRKGGRVSKSLKSKLRKNEVNKLSNQQLQQRFETKLQLFKESRLSHLLTSSDATEVKLANKIIDGLKLSFQRFIARRLVSDAQSTLQMNISWSQRQSV